MLGYAVCAKASSLLMDASEPKPLMLTVTWITVEWLSRLFGPSNFVLPVLVSTLRYGYEGVD